MKRFYKFSIALLLIIAILLGFWIFRANKVVAPATSKPSTKTIGSDVNAVSNFNKSQLSLSDPNSVWVVVNKQRPLIPKTFTPTDLKAVGGGQYLRNSAAQALSNFLAAVKQQGLIISPLSGYRSYQTQVAVYGNELKVHGQTIADTESARPGYSEHQTGLAIDVGDGGCNIADCFSATKQGQWLAANAFRYGFIIRYPIGKTSVTGYRYEPWHVRYVGTTLSTEMHNQNIETLEEFFNLPAAPSY